MIAETRVLRVAVVVFGASTLVFFFVLLASVVEQATKLHPVWTAAATSVVFALPVLTAAAQALLSVGTIRALFSAYAVGYLFVVLTFAPALAGGPLAVASQPWPLGVTALGIVAAALVWPPLLSCVYLGLVIVATAIVRVWVNGGLNLVIGLQDALFSLGFAAIFLALAFVVMRKARALDVATARARELAARAAAATARAGEQARLDAVIHDEVMAVLLYAASDAPELAQSLQRHAVRALDKLRSVELHDDETPVPVADFINRLRSVARVEGASVDFTPTNERSSAIPAVVASAFTDATAEALRNCVRHGSAGRSTVQVSVILTLTEKKIACTVADDGPGFDLRAVPAHRLGIRVSIRDRFGAIDGARTRIQSRRGTGTTIDLEWRHA